MSKKKGGRTAAGQVILRDWPRKRLSQNWTRGGAVNPSQRIVSFDEFADGELRDELKYIFGEKTYTEALQTVKNELKK